MATGRLAVANPTAGQNVLVYTVPSEKIASLNISVVNTSLDVCSLSMYISDSATVDISRAIEYMVTIPSNGGVLEREGLILTAGERIYVYAATNALSIRVHGFED